MKPKQFFASSKSTICPICKKEINLLNFNDRLSFKEFEISGLCQECQDIVFKDLDENQQFNSSIVSSSKFDG